VDIKGGEGKSEIESLLLVAIKERREYRKKKTVV